MKVAATFLLALAISVALASAIIDALDKEFPQNSEITIPATERANHELNS
jgi:hypothetical protein